MRISKAPELLKKAVTAFKIKTEVLRTRLLVLASLHRRTALVGAASRGIQSLVSSDGRHQKRARVEHGDRALVLRRAVAAGSQEPAAATADDHERDVGVIDLSEVAMFDEGDHEFPDWTHSLFEEDSCCINGDGDGHDDHGVQLDAVDEPSVIDIIRSNREVEGLEFNMDEEIDEACDIFIRRFRKRMNSSF